MKDNTNKNAIFEESVFEFYTIIGISVQIIDFFALEAADLRAKLLDFLKELL